MPASNSASEQFDNLDRDPDFTPEDSGPCVRRFSVFNSSAEISSLVQSDSESDDGEQKQTVVKKQVVKKRARDQSKWIRNIAKKGKAEGKSNIGIKNKNIRLKGERKTGKNCYYKLKCFTKINDTAKPPDCRWFYDRLKCQGEEEPTQPEEDSFTDD